jgi:hypothetical protein
VAENNLSDDMIYNWRNELRSHSDGVFVVASSQAQKYKNQGFDKSQVVELLAAENYDLEVANRVASKLFDSIDNTPVKQAIEVAVVPTKYSDCAPIIEKTLEKFSAKEFVKKLTLGEHSIVKTDSKGVDSWLSLVKMAKDNPNMRTSLHNELKPWVEEALLNSVLKAQSEKPLVEAKNNKIVVSMRKGTAEVDLQNATSTSNKFIEGNYAFFGLADEYMVSAADSVSPYARLKRALKD